MEYEAAVSVSPTEKLRLELSQNVDLIKIKRLCKKQCAYITSLEEQIKTLKEQTDYLTSSINISTNDKENTVEQLISEKERANKLEAQVTIFKGHIDALKEQLQDLQSEKAVLKLHNENLLHLSSQKDNTNCTDKRTKNFIEVEERLKMEINNTRELTAKLSDSELHVAMLQHELDKQTTLIQNLQRKTLQLKEYNTEISHQVEGTIGNKETRLKHVGKCNKATNTNIVDTDDDTFINDNNDNKKLNILSDTLTTKENEARAWKDENQKELQQCRNLLRIQHSLNQQYKCQIDHLQKIVQNKQFQNDNMIRDLQEIVFEHLNKINNNNMSEIYVASTKCELQNLPYLLKQILLYHLKRENLNETVNEESTSPSTIQQEGVDVVLEKKINTNNYCKAARRGSYTIVQPIQHCKMISNQADIKHLQFDNQISECSAKFEFSIGQAKFEQFPQHLKRYSANPKIFLTWSFYSEDEGNKQQAYTDVKSIDDATFACTCEYEGSCSVAFLRYLQMEGIIIEVHLVQDDISVRIGQIAIDTSQCIQNINHLCSTMCDIVGDHLRGTLYCNFKLICDEKLIHRYINVQN